MVKQGGGPGVHRAPPGKAVPPSLSLVVTTVGRVDVLEQLLASLESDESGRPFELVLVDQSPDGRCQSALAARDPSFAWQATSSGRGASVGRNVGIRLARAPVVGFPDDDCWFTPSAIGRALAVLDARPEVAGISGRALTADGAPSMLRWLSTPGPITPANYHRASIEFTLFLRRSLLEEIGGFDEGMGPGSAGPFGAGEGSDLLLRALRAGHRLRYEPDVVIHHPETREMAGEDHVAKMARYGRGQGLLWRRHRASPLLVAHLLCRKAGGVVLRRARGDVILSRADLSYLRGCLSGLAHRPPTPIGLCLGP